MDLATGIGSVQVLGFGKVVDFFTSTFSLLSIVNTWRWKSVKLEQDLYQV